MSKLTKGLLGAGTLAALAYLVTSKKGQEKIAQLFDKEETEPVVTPKKESLNDKTSAYKEKAQDLKEQALDTFQDYKDKYQQNDVSFSDLLKGIKEKTHQLKETTLERAKTLGDDLKDSRAAHLIKDATESNDDIIIEYQEDDNQ